MERAQQCRFAVTVTPYLFDIDNSFVMNKAQAQAQAQPLTLYFA